MAGADAVQKHRESAIGSTRRPGPAWRERELPVEQLDGPSRKLCRLLAG